MDKLIGVYGTLRKGESNHSVLGNSEFIKTISLAGYKMFRLSGFPTVIKGGLEDSIVVEIYRIRNHRLSNEIDLLEGFDRNFPNSKDNLYTVRLFRIESEKEPIEIYTFDHSPEMIGNSIPQLKSGDWTKRDEEND